MIERVVGFRLNKRFFIGIAVIVIVLVGFGLYAGGNGLSYKDLILGLGALIAAVIVFGGERGIRFGLVLWVLTLALGYRTVELTPNLRIHPSEILICLLFVCILARRRFLSAIRFPLPW